jgi:hypothetical protein
MRVCSTQIFAMNTTVRNICISGDLPSAEELLTQEIEATGDNYRLYANRSVVMARKLDWDHALDDAIKVRCSDLVTLSQYTNFVATIVPQHSAFINGIYF